MRKESDGEVHKGKEIRENYVCQHAHPKTVIYPSGSVALPFLFIAPFPCKQTTTQQPSLSVLC
jgi:hypothetical protein